MVDTSRQNRAARERERERIKDRREENHGIGGREEGKETKTVENSRERKPESLRA